MISSLPTATKTPLPKVTSLKDKVSSVLSADPPTLSETTTALGPTATKLLLPNTVEYKFIVVGEVLSAKVAPLSADIISFPLLPTEKNLLLPNVIPYSV